MRLIFKEWQEMIGFKRARQKLFFVTRGEERMSRLGEVESNPVFESVLFVDAGKSECVLKTYAAHRDTVDLGRVRHACITLDQQQVKDLIYHLQLWLDTGSFEQYLQSSS